MKQAIADGKMTIRPIKTLMNHATTEIFFDGVEVPAEALVGEEGKGFRYILDGMNAERILIAAECIGDGHWFVEKAAAYASERVVFGRPIGQNQGVQFPIAQARPDRGCRPDALQGAWLFEQGLPCGAEANMAKLRAAGASWAAANACLDFAAAVATRRSTTSSAVPRDTPLQGGAGLEQPHPGVRQPARARHAALMLMRRTSDLRDAGVPFALTSTCRSQRSPKSSSRFPFAENVKTPPSPPTATSSSLPARLRPAAVRAADALGRRDRSCASSRAGARGARSSPGGVVRRRRRRDGARDRRVLDLPRVFCGSETTRRSSSRPRIVAASRATVTELAADS
jgi:hypothetical protein